jgi:4-aminobutyrate aminotransferase/(S)-3-amino-2-methylpropionate transaminase
MAGTIQVPYPYCYRCPLSLKPDSCGFACLDLVKAQVNASSTGSLAATIIEPYLGAAGFIFPPDGYLKTLEQWVRDQGMLLILDEVQSSFGRTGKMFASEWDDLKPSIVPMAKGMGSGMPTSAIAMESRVGKCLGQGELSSTCGGNPLSSAAAAAVIDIIREEELVENSRRIGEVMLARFRDIQQHIRVLGDARGRGLVMGLEIVVDQKTKEPSRELTREIILRCARKGLLIGAVGPFGNVIRVAPPLIITEEQAHRSLDIMEDVLMEVSR